MSEPGGAGFVHRRVIEVEVSEVEGGGLEAVGRLTDTKGIAVSMYTGELLEAGGVPHDMLVRMVVDGEMTIRDVDVEMAAVPGPPCRSVVPTFQNLVGVRVGNGYRAALRERAGGIRGCAHVLELLTVMGAPIMQARWTIEVGPVLDPADILAYEGTCHVYAPGGPLLEELRRAAEADTRPGTA